MERVVVVHGLFRVPFQFTPLMGALRAARFEPVFFPYGSARQRAAESAVRLGEFLDRDCDSSGPWTGGSERVHFVGYSLGALVIRAALSARPDYPLGRLVMIAPPNRGAGLLAPPVPWLVAGVGGPALADLCEGSAFIRSLPPPPGGSCVIAGDRPHSPLFPSWWLRRRRGRAEPHDGVVEVRNTRTPGAHHVTVSETHTTICRSRTVIAMVEEFLSTGRLVPPKGLPQAGAARG